MLSLDINEEDVPDPFLTEQFNQAGWYINK